MNGGFITKQRLNWLKTLRSFTESVDRVGGGIPVNTARIGEACHTTTPLKSTDSLAERVLGCNRMFIWWVVTHHRLHSFVASSLSLHLCRFIFVASPLSLHLCRYSFVASPSSLPFCREPSPTSPPSLPAGSDKGEATKGGATKASRQRGSDKGLQAL
jgi:hypothetical protein